MPNTLHAHGYIYQSLLVMELLHSSPYLAFPDHDLDFPSHDYVTHQSTYITRLIPETR